MADQLKRCPMCKSVAIDCDYGQRYWCACMKCGIRGAETGDRHTANEEWNHLASLSSSQQAREVPLQSSPNAASTGMERDILAKLLDMRDTHLRVYEYEKQHYVIDHELWESARNALNSPQDSDRRNLGCDYCKNPLYAGLKCPGCGQEASKPQDERSLHEKMNMPPVSVQNLTIRTKE